MPTPKVDHTNTKCCRCGGSDTYIKGIDFEGKKIYKWYTCACDKKDCTGYLCQKCYSHIDSDERMKSVAHSRTGNLDRLSNHGKETIGEWISAKTLGVKDLNIENNRFREIVDLSIHSIYGMIDVKTCSFEIIYRYWQANIKRRTFDSLLVLCMDGYDIWKNVERIYIIPKDKIRPSSNLKIYKNSVGEAMYYEQFMVDVRPYNDIYHSVNIPRFFSPFDLWKGEYDKIV